MGKSANRIRAVEKNIDGAKYYKLFEKKNNLEYISETEKQIPVAYDVDVVVAGAGVSGLFAAIAAARGGAKTLLIDRFGYLGGNIGPGMIINGSLEGPIGKVLPGGPQGIPKEFLKRVDNLKTTDLLKNINNNVDRLNYAEEANIASYIAFKMTQEAGVELLLSVYVCDPIIENNMVKGVFIEGKSGRLAIKAKVVIDGTGDASVAERAGVPMIKHIPPDFDFSTMVHEKRRMIDFEYWNETALPYLIGGVDFNRYDKYAKEEIDFNRYNESTAFFRERFYGQYDSNSMFQMSYIEQYMREKAYEKVLYLRNNVVGFEKAYLMYAAPYVGARGGPFIEGEHTLTYEEAYNGKKFDDVLFINKFRRRFVKPGYNKEGFDTPYKILLPKNIEGLMVTGRGASYCRRGHDGTGTRVRLSLMSLGQACGIAASLAVKQSTTPKDICVKVLQKELINEGYLLGSKERQKELDLL